LLFSFDFTQSGQPRPPRPSVGPSATQENILILSDFASELRLQGGKGGGDYYVGQVIPKQSLVILQANVRTNLTFGLDLDHQALREIEKLRESKDLQFLATSVFASEIQGQPQTKSTSGFQLRFKVPKSDWAETILPALGFKTVSLIEIPRLGGSEFDEAIGHVDSAWKQYSMGEYDRVLTDCRKALESLSTKVKSMGYQKTVEEGNKKSLPDWGRLFGNDDLGDIVGTINQKTMGFISPGSHAGRTINREDADFALMITHAVVNLITRKLS
jgi:hypothetical protein